MLWVVDYHRTTQNTHLYPTTSSSLNLFSIIPELFIYVPLSNYSAMIFCRPQIPLAALAGTGKRLRNPLILPLGPLLSGSLPQLGLMP